MHSESCRKRVQYGAAGVTLLEIMIAVFILAIGLVPLFQMLYESRRVTTVSINELQATSLASSLIDGWKRLPLAAIQAHLEREYTDATLPPAVSLAKLGVPPTPAHLHRQIRTRLVNQPILPRQRFSDPWGRVLEITVAIAERPRRDGGTAPAGATGLRPILKLSSYLPLTR